LIFKDKGAIPFAPLSFFAYAHIYLTVFDNSFFFLISKLKEMLADLIRKKRVRYCHRCGKGGSLYNKQRIVETYEHYDDELTPIFDPVFKLAPKLKMFY
jgi:hypothetical protein